MSAISAGLGALIDGIANPSGAGGDPVTLDTLGPVLSDIADALTILRDTMDSADSKLKEADTAATEAGAQIEEIGNDVKQISEHTIHTIIPHSMSWLAGYVVSHFIDPLRLRIAQLQSQINFLLGWRNQIDDWRHKFVDPNVEKWVGFHEWFVTWPQSILFRWHEWFDHPDEFAQWAAPPLVGPIVSYLAGRDHAVSRDNLSLIMTAAWQEVPNRTWELILQYMVSDK